MAASTRVPQLRLFLALWPDEPTRTAIATWQQRWLWPSRAALVPRERLHLTLHFIGNVAAARLPELAAGLHVPFEPVELAFGSGTVWPGGIAVLRAEATPDALVQLHARLAHALEQLRLPVDTRPYRAHVTLARKASGATVPPDAAQVHWRADTGYVLVRSVGNGGGYEIVARFRQP